MFCSKCGTEIENDDLFCGNCGHPVVKAGKIVLESDDSTSDKPKYAGNEMPVNSDADNDTDNQDESAEEVSEDERPDTNDGDSDAEESQVEESHAEVSPVNEDAEVEKTDDPKKIIYQSAYTEQTAPDVKKRLLAKRRGTLIYLSVCILIGLFARVLTKNYLNVNNPEKRYEKYLNEGIESLSCHDYTSAEKSFLTAIDLDPQRLTAYQQLSDTYLNMNSTSDLGELFRKASENLDENDLNDLKTYMSEDLTSAIKRFLRQDETEYVSQYIELIESIDKSAADSIREMIEESGGE